MMGMCVCAYVMWCARLVCSTDVGTHEAQICRWFSAITRFDSYLLLNCVSNHFEFE